MKPILRWQYDQLIKELLLLQDHQADPSCPCETESEMCVRKHLYTIEAYAEETIPIEDNNEFQGKLRQLAEEARELRTAEEIVLAWNRTRYPTDPLEWSRNWPKAFESYTLPVGGSDSKDSD